MLNSVESGLNFPRFSLGTAQFRISSYGIANRLGQPPYAACWPWLRNTSSYTCLRNC